MSPFSTAPAATFDFDISPLLAETQNTPFNQTSNDITAQFSSPSETTATPSCSIQSYDTTFIELSQFSGKCLDDDKPSRDILEILFSTQLRMITFTFATVESYRKSAFAETSSLGIASKWGQVQFIKKI